jgi:hypothetical protein
LTPALGRCEKLIIPPIIMNHILKVAYGHKKNNKTIHLNLGSLGAIALFDLLEGIKYKGFSKFIKEKYDICNFKYFHVNKFSKTKSDPQVEKLWSQGYFRHQDRQN